PVRLGLVASLARPGGNLTGVNILATEVVAKRLALLRELIPAAARVAVLVDPANKEITEATLRGVGTAARAMGLQSHYLNSHNRSAGRLALCGVRGRAARRAVRQHRDLVYRPPRATRHPGGAPHDSHDIRQPSNYRSGRTDELRSQYC